MHKKLHFSSKGTSRKRMVHTLRSSVEKKNRLHFPCSSSNSTIVIFMIPPCPQFCLYFFIKAKELKPLMESGMANADILQSKHCRKASADFLPYSLLLFAFCASSIPSHFKCFCFTVTTNLSLYLQSPNDCTSYFIPYFLERVSHFPLQLMQLLVRPAFAFFLLFLLLLLPFITPNSL